ncbi:PKD-like domain-containing protein [Pontibacter ummariensis]|uniref:PKD-like domain-containing protein n=1 Tax=Pontibacter ummariensis TaxID=1610492 RepID=UPI001C626BF4|nr:PKD-like domain-containing protein [Pontibacter ummariensis]
MSSDNGTSWSSLPASATYTVSTTSLPVSSGATTLNINNVTGLNGYKYRVQVVSTSTSDLQCSIISSAATLTVNPTKPASVSISSNATNNTICAGTSVTFTATPTNGGSAPSYQWKLNGSNVGSNSAAYTSSTLTSGDKVSVVMTSNASPCLTGSPATSNEVTMVVNAKPAGSNSTAVICSGQETDIPLSSSVAGAAYTWTATLLASPSGGEVTGFSSCNSSCGASIKQRLINSGTTERVVRYTITPLANDCEGNPFTVDVTVKPLAAAPILHVENDCNGTSTVTARDASGNLIASGELAWSDNGNGNPRTVNSAVTLTATRTISGGCTSAVSSSVVTAPKAAPAAPTVCIVQPSLCGPAKGSVTIVSPTGEGFLYTVNNGATWQSSPVFAELEAGSVTGIKVKNPEGCISAAADCSVSSCESPEVLPTTSVISSLQVKEHPKAQDQLTAYPVPFSESTTLEFKAEQDGKYEINLYDMKGALVRQLKAGTAKAGEVTRIEVNGSSMREGMYLARMMSATGVKTVKLLKKER